MSPADTVAFVDFALSTPVIAWGLYVNDMEMTIAGFICIEVGLLIIVIMGL